MPRSSISLFRRVEKALETIALGSTPLETIHTAAGFIAENFADDLGIRGGRINAQDDGSYELVETFPPGDLLVLYTDGITEANDNSGNEEYGRDRLLKVIRASCHLDPIAIVDRVFTDIDDFSAASPPMDDQTLVVVKRQLQTLEEIPA